MNKRRCSRRTANGLAWNTPPKSRPKKRNQRQAGEGAGDQRRWLGYGRRVGEHPLVHRRRAEHAAPNAMSAEAVFRVVQVESGAVEMEVCRGAKRWIGGRRFRGGGKNTVDH